MQEMFAIIIIIEPLTLRLKLFYRMIEIESINKKCCSHFSPKKNLDAVVEGPTKPAVKHEAFNRDDA